MTSRNKVNKKVLFEAANIKMFYIILFRSLGYGPGLDASANVKDILRRLSKESQRIMKIDGEEQLNRSGLIVMMQQQTAIFAAIPALINWIKS